jgi:hypothetical protein
MILAIGSVTAGTIAAWATFVVALVAAGFALLQVNAARRLREEQTRPFVVVDFDARSIIVDLVIENVGPTLAQNVHLAFDPPLVSSLKSNDLSKNPALVYGFPTLVPGKKIRILFDRYPDRLTSGLPMTFNVEVSYAGPTGKARRKTRRKTYSEPYVLDLVHMEHTLVPEPTVNDVLKKGFENVTRAVDQLAK